MKKIILILLITTLCRSFVYANNSSEFTDLSIEHWAYDEIMLLKEMQVIGGYSNGSFKPEDFVTREEFAVMLSKAFGLNQTSQNVPSFTDVSPSHWSYTYVEAAKDYLTGYYPYGGKAFYQPELFTTREDVTVALIRALNIEETIYDEVDFLDAEDISRNMRRFIAVAVTENLISGYEDQTFRPQNPISRAEIAVLIHKSLKQSNFEQKFVLEVVLPEKTHFNEVVVSGKTHPDADVTVNGYAVSNNEGRFSGIYHIFDGEGIYDMEIVARMPDGTKKYDYRSVEYKLPEGYFNVNIVETTTEETVYASGLIYGFNYEHSVTVNGQGVQIKGDGQWNKKINLVAGENHIVFKLKDAFDTVHTVEKTVVFQPQGSNLTFNYLPDKIMIKNTVISGQFKDDIDLHPKLFVNNKPLQVNGSGHFTFKPSLKVGQNSFEFLGVNKYGISTSQVVKFDYSISVTKFLDLSYPSMSKEDHLNLSFVCENESGEDFTLYIDGKQINPLVNRRHETSVSKEYRLELDLEPGTNEFTFELDTMGEKTEKIVTVEFLPVKPTIEILNMDENTYYLQVKAETDIFSFFNGSKISKTSVRKINDEYKLYYYTVDAIVDNNEFTVKDIYGQESILKLEKGAAND